MSGLCTLVELVREAEQTCEAQTCDRHGHAWESGGGRACPRGCSWSQNAYRCRRCGAWDYGEPGGPGHEDCFGAFGNDEQCCDGTTEAGRAADEAAEDAADAARAARRAALVTVPDNRAAEGGA